MTKDKLLYQIDSMIANHKGKQAKLKGTSHEHAHVAIISSLVKVRQFIVEDRSRLIPQLKEKAIHARLIDGYDDDFIQLHVAINIAKGAYDIE